MQVLITAMAVIAGLIFSFYYRPAGGRVHFRQSFPLVLCSTGGSSREVWAETLSTKEELCCS